MSLAPDPSLRGLDGCGCGEGTGRAVPAAVSNRPGLAAIAYRPGTHASFRRSLLAALSTADRPALRALSAREDDFTPALLDAWASVADVLTFYGERIANESYLRTATETFSVRELARSVGYELAPGVAASTHLAFTVEEAPGSPPRTTIPARTRVQSVPGPDEKPQSFETEEEIEARADWNAFALRRLAPQRFALGAAEAWVAGAAAAVRPGDAVLLVGDERAEDAGSERWDVRTLTAVEPVPAAGATRLALDAGLGAVRRAVRIDPAARSPRLHVFRRRGALFGHNAPDWRALPDEVRRRYVSEGEPSDHDDWPGLTLAAINARARAPQPADASHAVLHLDGLYPGIVPGSWVTLTVDGYSELYRVERVEEAAVSDFTLAGRVTRLTVSGEGLMARYGDRVRDTAVLLATEPLPLALRPVAEPVGGGAALELDRLVDGLPHGRRLLVTGRRPRVRVGAAGLALVDAAGGRTLLEEGETLIALARPLAGEDGARTWALRDRTGREGTVAAEAGALEWTAAEPGDPLLSEAAVLERAAPAPDRRGTVLHLREPLGGLYDPASVAVAGNVALATHGATVREVLGSGDAARPHQRFQLREPPLTHVTTPSGLRSTLEVWVGGVRWTGVDTLYGRDGGERVYVTRQVEGGGARVQFGDGHSGARLPTGSENVAAVYRTGIGAEGNVGAGQLSLLMTRPLGVRSVSNPLPATGGTDPEALDQARANAPLRVLALDRIVSLRDYADFARTFGGVAKALATWTWAGRRRGALVTVAGPGGMVYAPTEALLEDLRAAMAAAGDARVPVRVAPYRPVAFRVGATLRAEAAHDPARVLAEAEAALAARFSFEAAAFGEAVALSEVVATLQNVAGVAAVDVDHLHRDDRAPAFEAALEAHAPRPGEPADSALAAELLTLRIHPGDLRVLA